MYVPSSPIRDVAVSGPMIYATLYYDGLSILRYTGTQPPERWTGAQCWTIY
jgi:hypothetical protein